MTLLNSQPPVAGVSETEDWVLPLSLASDAGIVGGKAVNLCQLIQAGFNVPGGFVVTTSAFHFARDGGLQDRAPSIPPQMADELRRQYRAIGSPPVAVRSSATAEDLAHASMAGQYDTFLNVVGEDDLLDRVERCWASLDTPRVRAYLQQHAIPHEGVAMAVVVQRLVPAEIAGVLFTCNPRDERLDQMLIEATWGLGEMLVSGHVQPDTLTLDHASGRVLNLYVGDKSTALIAGGGEESTTADQRARCCLASQDVQSLWRLGRQIEKHFGSPQDVEWARSGGEIYLLQARAVTTAISTREKQAARQEAAAELRRRRAAGDGPWVLHNLAETLPHPTPLTWSVIDRFYSAEGGYGRLYTSVGFAPGPKVSGRGFLDLVLGNVYMDLGRAPEMFAADFPYAYDPEHVRGDPNAGQSPPTIARGTFKARRAAAAMLGRVDRQLAVFTLDFDRQYVQSIRPAFINWCKAEKQRDLNALSNNELIELWEARQARVMDEFAPESLLPSFIAGKVIGDLQRLLNEHLWDENPQAMAMALSSGGPANHTVIADHELFEVAHGRMPIETWLSHHGHRCSGEFDLATPRWRERSQDVLRLATTLLNGEDPLNRQQSQVQRAREEAARCERLLPATDRAEFREQISQLHRYVPFRENAKNDLMQGYDLLRDITLTAGRRTGAGDGIFLLDEEEFRQALRTGVAPLETIEQRRLRRQAEPLIEIDPFIDDRLIAALEGSTAASDSRASDTAAQEPAGVLRAYGLSPGKGRGHAAILESPESGAGLSPGYVLVCKSTDPSWTPLFVNAAAVVLDRGGSLSHGAVVAREMGIPAVVLPGATKLFQPGEMLDVDGRAGLIRRGIITADPPDFADDSFRPATNDDTLIPPAHRPPQAGTAERRSAMLRNIALGVWTIYLLAFFLLPDRYVRAPSLQLLDWAVWPLVRHTGRVAGVAIIAAALALLTMTAQRLLTDHKRLSEAKRRAGLLSHEASQLPDGPRKTALLAAARPVQGRVTLAAFVPLAVLLGPLIILFLWLGERVDPALTTAMPGERVQIIATLNGDWMKPVRLQSDADATLTRESLPKSVPRTREGLIELRSKWSVESDLSAVPWELRAAARATRASMLADLDAFLAGEMKSQQLAWTITAPAKEGVHVLQVQSEGQRVPARIVVGGDEPPQPERVAGHVRGIEEVRIVYPPRQEKSRVFWRPFSWTGWGWDAGWLGVYIAAYVPVMLIAKRLLRVP